MPPVFLVACGFFVRGLYDEDLARASFGVWGANLPALLTRNATLLAFHQNSHLLGHSTLDVICFVVVWALQLLIIQNGMETVRKFQDWAGPAVWIAMLVPCWST